MVRCKNCKYFEPAIDIHTEEKDPLQGHCPLLLKILQLSNGYLFFQKELFVYEAFGCTLGREKDE